jgi:small nuclear ribonucleoprotein (snRNP)-like protein
MIKNIIAGVLIVGAYFVWAQRDVSHGPGITAPEKPVISRLAWSKATTKGDYVINPIRSIKGEVRILKKKRYYLDELQDLMPYDFFVGWDDMSDERNLSHMFINLDSRDVHLEFSNHPLSVNQVYSQTDLFHIIPANEETRDVLAKVRNGHIVSFKGHLVSVEKSPNLTWTSSVNFNEIGTNSNKIIWVEELTVR